MPKKVRELEKMLRKAGFVLKAGRKPGKGSHRNYEHPEVKKSQITISGNSGKDARRYQEDDVQDMINFVKRELGRN